MSADTSRIAIEVARDSVLLASPTCASAGIIIKRINVDKIEGM